jgi:hypothetical protein
MPFEIASINNRAKRIGLDVPFQLYITNCSMWFKAIFTFIVLTGNVIFHA